LEFQTTEMSSSSQPQVLAILGKRVRVIEASAPRF
jgi:hypothetical protein